MSTTTPSTSSESATVTYIDSPNSLISTVKAGQLGYAPGIAINNNAEAGPSRITDSGEKKRKFSRSRTACVQCRIRKSKCGARPPGPCPNCITSELSCQWPANDGRSSKVRLQKSKSSNLAAFAKQGVGTVAQMDLITPTSMDSGKDRLNDWFWQSPGTGPSQMFPPVPSLQNPHPDLRDGVLSSSVLPSSPTFRLSEAPLQNPPLDCSDPSIDLAQFVWAVSSQLPTVEESSPNDERSSLATSTGGELNTLDKRTGADGKIVKITWWRPHGQTAIAPGLKRITLKVRMDSGRERNAVAGAETGELFLTNGMPNPVIMRHLLDVFMTHFGSQFPFLERQRLEYELDTHTESVFLFNCIAATAARFSTLPVIALPSLQPSAYGNRFSDRAKDLLGSMLSVPSRDTVIALVLLAHIGFANDSESEEWIMTGIAVRMAIDLGLHLDSRNESISEEEQKLNRLAFWSVLLLDYALSFGTGRQTTFRVEEITQTLPTEADFSVSLGETPPFVYAAKQMLLYGPVINILNGGRSDHFERELQFARSRAIGEYNNLPTDMQWNVANLQRHCRANQGSIYLHLHLWMHTIIASEYFTGTNFLRRPIKPTSNGTRSGTVTPNSLAASNLWRNSVRTIGDILVLSDIIDPYAYFALPFVNQAFYVAGCCYIKEIEQHHGSPPPPSRISSRLEMTPINSHPEGEINGSKAELSRALLASVASTNISTLQSGLAKQTIYWAGVAWVAGALGQRISGVRDIDLALISEKLASSVSLPDAGLVQRSAKLNGTPNSGSSVAGRDWGNGVGDFDIFSLPFDIGSIPQSRVTEQEVPIPTFFGSDWFRQLDGEGVSGQTVFEQ